MLTAITHFAFGFIAMAAISYLYARRLGEKNGSMIAVGLVSGILCASMATFMTPWASPVVVLLLAAGSHREYLESRKYSIKRAKTSAMEIKTNVASENTKETGI